MNESTHQAKKRILSLNHQIIEQSFKHPYQQRQKPHHLYHATVL